MSERRRSPKVGIPIAIGTESPGEVKAERLKAKGKNTAQPDTVENHSAFDIPHSEIKNKSDIEHSKRRAALLSTLKK